MSGVVRTISRAVRDVGEAIGIVDEPRRPVAPQPSPRQRTAELQTGDADDQTRADRAQRAARRRPSLQFGGAFGGGRSFGGLLQLIRTLGR